MANYEFIDKSEASESEGRLVEHHVLHRGTIGCTITAGRRQLFLRAGTVQGLIDDPDNPNPDDEPFPDRYHLLRDIDTTLPGMTHGAIFEEVEPSYFHHTNQTAKTTTLPELRAHLVTAAPAFGMLLMRGEHVGFSHGHSFYAVYDGDVSFETVMQKRKLLSEHKLDDSVISPMLRVGRSKSGLRMRSPTASDASHSEMPQRYCAQVVAFLLAMRHYPVVNHNIRKCVTNRLLLKWGSCPDTDLC